MDPSIIPTPPLTRHRKRAAEAEEQNRQKEAEGEKRQRRMFQPRKIRGALPTSGMVNLIGPNDIIVNRKNPQKIKIEEEVDVKPMIAGMPNNEEGVNMPRSQTPRTPATVNQNALVQDNEEVCGDDGDNEVVVEFVATEKVLLPLDTLGMEAGAAVTSTVKTEASDDEGDIMEVGTSATIFQNENPARVKTSSDNEDEDLLMDSSGGTGRLDSAVGTSYLELYRRCQELETIRREQDLRIKKLEQELESLKQMQHDPIARLCQEVDKEVDDEDEDSQNPPIFLAILEGKSKEEIQRLVERGVKWDIQNSEGDTILHIAAKAGGGDLLQYLISISDQQYVNKENASQSTPLMEAARFSENFLEVFKNFVEKSANLNTTDRNGEDLLSIAIAAGRSYEEIKAIDEAAKSDDLTDANSSRKLTYLHMAAENGNLEAVKYFLSKNHDVNVKKAYHNGNRTPLMCAAYAKQNFVPIVDLLLQSGADISVGDGLRWNVLYHAIKYGRSLNDLKKLITAGAPWNTITIGWRTILHVCVEFGHVEALKYFINEGADVNDENDSGETPIMLAAMLGMCDAMKLLIDEGAEFEASELLDLALEEISDFKEPLKKSNLYDTLQKLVELGAISKDNNAKRSDIDARDSSDRTPLMRAVMNPAVPLQVIEVLIDMGADVNAVDEDGFNVLHLATGGNGWLGKLGRPLEVIEMLISHGATWNNGDSGREGNSILHAAIMGGRLEVLQFFISKGADINEENYRRETPFLYAVKHNRRNFGEMLRMLVKAGADPNAVDRDRNNALLLGMNGDWWNRLGLEKLKLLAHLGCDGRIPNKEGVTFFSVLKERRDTFFHTLLFQYLRMWP